MPQLRRFTPSRKLTIQEDCRRIELIQKIYNTFSTRDIEKVLKHLYIHKEIQLSENEPIVPVPENVAKKSKKNENKKA